MHCHAPETILLLPIESVESFHVVVGINKYVHWKTFCSRGETRDTEVLSISHFILSHRLRGYEMRSPLSVPLIG